MHGGRDATGHIVPHGGSLVSLMVDAERRRALEAASTHRQVRVEPVSLHGGSSHPFERVEWVKRGMRTPFELRV